MILIKYCYLYFQFLLLFTKMAILIKKNCHILQRQGKYGIVLSTQFSHSCTQLLYFFVIFTKIQ